MTTTNSDICQVLVQSLKFAYNFSQKYSRDTFILSHLTGFSDKGKKSKFQQCKKTMSELDILANILLKLLMKTRLREAKVILIVDVLKFRLTERMDYVCNITEITSTCCKFVSREKIKINL